MKDIKNIIISAGEILKKEFFNLKSYSTKEKYDLVTRSDLLIENILIDELCREYPDYSIYSEEIGSIVKSNERRWIIDPIDGTANFIFGVPYFCISICLESLGVITEAYVYNPITEELYYSGSEGRSFLNGNEIRASENGELENCLAVFGFSANHNNIERYYKEWAIIFESAKKGMPLLSPALNICNVARGRTDCFIDFGSSMEGHAAAAHILKNAGGRIYNYDLSEWNFKSKGVIATNSSLLIEQFRK